MATFPRLNQFNQTIVGIDSGDPQPSSYSISPFEAFVTRIDYNTGIVYIKVSYYSNLFTNFIENETSVLPISGIDFEFPIIYPSKVYMEIIYDQNLTPIYGKIKVNPKWSSTTIDPVSKSSVITYPNEIEFITNLDLSQKTTDLQNDNTDNETVRAAHLQQIQLLVNSGYFSQSEALASKKIVNDRYDSIKKVLTPYISNFSQFFQGSSGLSKKLFKTFSLIAYTTKDKYPGLKGVTINPPTITNQQPSNQTQTTTPDNSFKLVQCVTSDLMIMDVYTNNLAAKFPVAWSNGVNKYILSTGNTEEITNTSK